MHFDKRLTGRLFFWFYGLLFAVGYVAFFPRFLAAFPGSYTWSELMLAYQGGYVRRGLIGEVAFLLDRPVGARDLLASVVAVAYAIVMVFYVREARRQGFWIGSLFLLSPATLMFPLLDPAAFGRKDVLILLAFAASTMVGRSVARRPALALIALIYTVANFVVDSAIFYAPMAVFVALKARGGGETETARGVTLSSLCVAAMSLLNWGLNAKFDDDNMFRYQAKIVAAWRVRYPDAFQPNSAVEYIGLGLSDGLQLVVNAVWDPATLLAYATCLALALVPTFAVLTGLDRARTSRWDAAACTLALAWGFAPFVIAADWGRYIHLLAMHAFVVAASLPTLGFRGPSRWTTRAVTVAGILAYALSWRMEHFVGAGEIALLQGVAFGFP